MELVRLVVIVVVATAAWACQSSSAFDRGRDAARASHWDEAVRYYERALAEEPDNVEYRIALDRARLNASRAHLVEARSHAATADFEAAIEEFELALVDDPTNRYARDELDELHERLGRETVNEQVTRVSPFNEGAPVLDPRSQEPLHIKFPEGSSLRTVLESLAELAGVSILFDESFRDKRIAVDLEGVSYREALDILMQTHGLFYKDVSSTTVRVFHEI